MQERGSEGSKAVTFKAGLANISREAAPYFANYRLTENAIVAAGHLASTGHSLAPAVFALGALKHIGGRMLINFARASAEKNK